MKAKRIGTIAAAALLVSVTFFGGCGDDSREKELESQVEQLEQKVTDLEEQNTETDNTGTESADKPGESASETQSGTEPQVSPELPPLEELAQSVSAAAEKVNTAKPAGTQEEQLAQYRELKKEIDAIDRNLDVWDDSIETQYEQGAITREEYRAKDREIDSLEGQLDESEDQLEYLFGIDD
ncbi:hypothetical protein [Lactonifactor longoviformis]|uniref:hypothetical protein n=1 Tax=Lactonifactor longoviformis TaxID=341220 RepID=UPI0036F273E1